MAASSFVIIAHRGDSSAAPENTLQAFDLALAKGFPNFETDCQLSADGVPVVLHDENLGRVNNGSGPAAAATLEQLQQLDAGSWFGPQFAGARIPMLEGVLLKYRGRVHMHLVSLAAAYVCLLFCGPGPLLGPKCDVSATQG
jgi:glycerophosphoryl diester phosphodiesterase